MVAQKAENKSTEQSPEKDSKARLRLWINLLRASRFIEAEIRDRLRLEFDVTLPRFDVMAALYRQPNGMMMSQLSRYLMVSNGNVTGIVDRLVKDGLVLRSQRDGDRRTWIICLTANGIATFEKMAAVHELWIDELLQDFSGIEAEELQETMARLNSDWETK